MVSVLRTVSIFFANNNNLKKLHRFLVEEDQTMDSSEFDRVKAEKDVAMRRFNRRRKFNWLFEACAVLFVLAQSSNYWLPITAEFSGYLFRKTVAIFRSHLFVFALFNSIILAVYALSVQIPRNDAASEPKDLYGEVVTNSERISAEEESPAPEDEKAVITENAGDSTTRAVENLTAAEPKANDCADGTETAENEKALVVKSSCERTRSARFPRSTMADESRREFRRSYTDVCRRLTSCGEEEASAVNRMSNEEFKRWIEDYIATKKWIQHEEYKEERKTERFMPLTVCQ